MGCVQSYFKRAHNAGLSPSSTQDSNSKPPVSDEDAKPISEEKSITEEPESNDTSYGVEATAVRTLAATTGTVAILGTTAKTNDKNKNGHDEDNEAPNTTTPPMASDVIPEGNEKEEEDTIAVVHDTTSKAKNEVSRNESEEEVKKTTSPLDTRPTSAVKTEHILLEEVKTNIQSTTNHTDVDVDNMPSPVDDVEKRTSAEHAENVPSTIESEKSKPEEDLSITNEENAKVTPEKTDVDSGKEGTSEVSNTETKPKEDEVTKNEDAEEDKDSEINKGNEEDNSKSISSERLKTNSISDTTLSESYNAELENNSIKQSPSADKAAESFDSSSTIEFVDLENKESARQKRDANDLPEVKEPNAPSETTEQAEVNQTGIVNLESEPSNDMLLNVSSEVAENQLLEAKSSERTVDIVGTELNSVLNNTSPEAQIVTPLTADHFESVVTSYEPQQAESGPQAGEVVSHIDHFVLSNSEELKVEDQNESEVIVNKIDNDGEVVDETVNAAVTTIQATFRGFQTRKQLKEEKEDESQVKVEKEETVDGTESNDANIVVTEEKQVTEGEKRDDTTPKEKLKENVDEDSKIGSAATTIQATFRGFQTRKQLKEEIKVESKPDLEDKENINEEKVVESQVNENVTETSSDKADSVQTTRNVKADELQESSVTAKDDEINSAATTIQATFRGFQTRKQLKDETKEELEGDVEKENILEATSDNTGLVLQSEQITEVQKEVQSNINEEEKTTNEAEDDKTNAAATAIQATFRGFQTRKQLKHETDNEPVTTTEENVNITEATKEEEIENISDDGDDKINSAATTIQATFRGFQTRKQLKDEKQEIEDNAQEADNITETAGAKTDTAAVVEEDTKVKAIIEIQATEEKEVNAAADNVVKSAATTIQATFRGYQARKQLKEEDESQTKAEEEEILSETVDTKTDSTEEASEHKVADDSQLTEEQNESETDKKTSAATTIQATFRGFQTRKQLMDEKEDEPLSAAEAKENVNEPTEQTKEDNETKVVAITEESKETIVQAVDDIIDSAATTIQAAFRGFQLRQQLKNEETEETVSNDLPIESERPSEPIVSSNADDASQVTEDLAATKIQATFRGFQIRQQLKNEEKDENVDNKLEHSPVEHGPSELSKTSEDESEQLKRQSEGDKDSLSEEIRQSLSKLEDTIQTEENKLNMASERLPEQTGDSSDEGYEQPDASGDGSFDRGTRTPTALTPEQIDIVKEEVDEICKQAVATTESILAVKSGLGDSHTDDAESKQESEDKETHTETPNDNKEVAVASSGDATQNYLGKPETLVVIEDADEKLVSAATTIQATFRGYQTRQKLAETEQPDAGASKATDEEVWYVLKNEMSEAATVIQSNYRGYRARKQLQREDAVQVLTSSSSVATNGVSSIDRDVDVPTRNSGELHDIIALTPPNIEQSKV